MNSTPLSYQTTHSLTLKAKNDRRNSGGTLRQKETAMAEITAMAMAAMAAMAEMAPLAAIAAMAAMAAMAAEMEKA